MRNTTKDSTPLKRDEIIRVRAESELKERIARIARSKKKKPSELLREYLWRMVEEDDAK